MKSLQALREQRAAKAKEVRNLLDPGVVAYTKETEKQVDTIYAEIDLIDSQIKRIEQSIVLTDDLDAQAQNLADQEGGSTDHATQRIKVAKTAFVKALRFGVENLSAEEKALISADTQNNRHRVQNVAVGTPGVSTTGGILVPTIVMPSLLIKLKEFGGMRLIADVLATSGGNPFMWGTFDDTAAEGEIVGENTLASDDDMTFGSVSIGAYKFSSKTIPISMEILQDAAIDVEAIVLNALAMRIARGQNRYFTTGTGTNQPKGVVTAAGLGYTMPVGNTTSVSFDGLVELLHAVDPAYRIGSKTAFMMNDSTFKAIKKLKDGNGRPLWLPSTEAAFGGDESFDSLLGKRLVINQHMASMAANAKSILFGDFSKYLIRDVMDVLILRFTDSAYAKKAQVGFLAWARADGNMIDASNESIRYLANSAT
jgi:HK97 family phage major capsid protein